MERRGSETHLDTQEASGGEKSGIVRYVLLISLGLAIIALSATWMTGALSAPENSGMAADTQSAQAS